MYISVEERSRGRLTNQAFAGPSRIPKKPALRDHLSISPRSISCMLLGSLRAVLSAVFLSLDYLPRYSVPYGRLLMSMTWSWLAQTFPRQKHVGGRELSHVPRCAGNPCRCSFSPFLVVVPRTGPYRTAFLVHTTVSVLLVIVVHPHPDIQATWELRLLFFFVVAGGSAQHSSTNRSLWILSTTCSAVASCALG